MPPFDQLPRTLPPKVLATEPNAPRVYLRERPSMRALLLCGITLFFAALGLAQDVDYATWSAKLENEDIRAGESTRVLFHVKTEPKWHIYGVKQPEGPISTAFAISAGPFKAAGEVIAPEGVKKYDANFEKDLVTYDGEAVFALPVTLAADASGEQTAKFAVTYQACTEGTCDIPKFPELEVKFTVAPGAARPDRMAASTDVPDQPAGYVAPGDKGADSAGPGASDDFNAGLQKAQDEGLLPFIWLSFVAGLLALLTPCVFPMVPITVSFFSKSVEGERKTKYGAALAYCLGIIATFTALGLIVTLAFGATGIQALATNPWVNFALVLVFVALALSLFGLFEIGIPSSVLTKLGGASRAGGVFGPLLMGLTFTLTSFTCTVPIVGTLLAGAAAGGSLLYPIAGMLAFSTAFALPFFFLALFPQALAKLPKSGAWLSTVKVFMGFLELAAALKFLSNVDLVWQLAWITKPVFLAIWAAIAFFAGFHLLGWVRLAAETPAKVGWIRRGFGVAMLIGAGFCLAGMNGVRLGEMEAFFPPDPYPGTHAVAAKGQVEWKTDFEEGAKLARDSSRRVFVNFTGVTCTNCRWMEKNMFTDPDVAAAISKYVAVELFTDRTTPEDAANRELQRKLTKVVTLPVYVIATPDGKPIQIFQGSTRDKDAFLEFLKKGQDGNLALNAP